MAKTWKIPLLAANAISTAYPNGYDKGGVEYVAAATGSLCHYAREGYDSVDWRVPIKWVAAPYEFEARLVLDSLHSGRSAKYTHWINEDTRQVYPMFVAELIKLIKAGVAKEGGIVTGRFGVVKRGQNYGIEYLG